MSMGTDLKQKEIAQSRFLSFSLGNEEYGIPLLDVKEVIALPEFTPVPNTPNYFLGLMNLRGQVISVLDLRMKLGIKPAQSQETAVIICDLAPLCIGVVVDSINSVLAPLPSEISEKPEVNGGKGAECITNVVRKEKKLVMLLDLAKALSVEDQLASARMTKTAA